jgi:hypothetical protein
VVKSRKKFRRRLSEPLKRVDVTGADLSPEEAEALASGRLKQEFLDNPSEFLSETDEFVARNVEQYSKIRHADLDLIPAELDELEPKYTVGRADGRELDPESFLDRSVEDFLGYWRQEIGEHENVDFGYAEEVLQGDRSGSWEEIESRFDLQPHSVEAMEKDDPVYSAVVEEMLQTLYGQALNRDEEFKREVESFERVLKNYDMEPYREIVENDHEYEVEHLTEQDEMLRAADASGSCIEDIDRYFAKYAEDEYSMISEVRKDGESMGYIRNFLMEDDSGHEFLALDTVEIDHKNFDQNSDVVRAAGMASIQMMYDLEADYLVGSDSRVKYGLRQAFGNTEKSVRGRKIGDRRVKSYSFPPSGTHGKSAYMLMENPG